MSAIFGIYNSDGKPVVPVELNRMSDTLAHRGADGADVWVNRAIGLGHRMLWNTPESLHEHLPLVTEGGDLAITADARLDNRDELIRLLHPTVGRSGVITDSELILAAYERWGELSFEKLIGDFVFAIWDNRKQTLYCVRDPLGVKHFYYYHSKHFFAFASEIKALCSLEGVPKSLNEVALADFLLPVYEDKAGTFYKDIFRLPSCQYIKVMREGVHSASYWQPDVTSELRLGKNENYEEAFLELFTEAVRCRLRSAFPVASMLSGGLDSSSVCCVAGRLLAESNRPRLHTFSGIWPNLAKVSPEIDERRFVNAVVSREAFEHHSVRADELSPLNEYDKMLWHQDNPLSATNMYMDWAIFKAAHEHGARTLLGGTDGDTTVSYGYEDLGVFALRGQWITLVKESIAHAKNMPATRHNMKNLVWKCGFKAALRTLLPESIIQGIRVVRGRPRYFDETTSLPEYLVRRPFNAAFAQRIGITERFWKLQRITQPLGVTFREFHWNALSSGLFAYILETYEKSCGAYSVEPRHPFFDRRLIQFCISLPPGQKFQNGWTRSILRRAMEGILPPEVQWRADKGNMAAGLKVNLLNYEKEKIENIVLRNTTAIEDFVDVAWLRSDYRKYEAEPMGHLHECYSVVLAVALDTWLRSSGLAAA